IAQLLLERRKAEVLDASQERVYIKHPFLQFAFEVLVSPDLFLGEFEVGFPQSETVSGMFKHPAEVWMVCVNPKCHTRTRGLGEVLKVRFEMREICNRQHDVLIDAWLRPLG